MKTRRKTFSEDDSRRNTLPEISTNGIGYTEPIPIDLIIEILLRLPAKSIAKCRCVSKLWASMLRRPDFTELFLTRSQSRPNFLFACRRNRKFSLFSAPQPQNPSENSSSLAATYHMKVTFDIPDELISHVNGLVLVRDQRIVEGRKNAVLVTSICNPSTGQSLTLPKVKTKKRIGIHSFFGYDPIGRKYKVLSMVSRISERLSEAHQVLTLGTDKPSWRMIECCIPPHYSSRKGICINGVVYYIATYNYEFPLHHLIVCFDIGSEQFKCVNLAERLGRAVFHGTLINYNGKLGSIMGRRCVDRAWRGIKLWVLEDAEKEEWSEHTYLLSNLCKDIVGRTDLLFVGVTRTNEIVLSSHDLAIIIYYNIERITMTRFEVQGINVSKYDRFQTFIDHVEDVKLM